MRQIGVWKRSGATYLVAQPSEHPVCCRNASGSRTDYSYLDVFRLAVFADFLKSAAVGAPLLPGALILSPLPALILALLALMFA